MMFTKIFNVFLDAELMLFEFCAAEMHQSKAEIEKHERIKMRI